MTATRPRPASRLLHRLARLPLHPDADADRTEGDFCRLCDEVPVGYVPPALFPRTRAEGCPCGAPATRVRYETGNLAGTESDSGFFSCDAHTDVNGWRLAGDGTWAPVDDYSPAALAYLTRALPG